MGGDIKVHFIPINNALDMNMNMNVKGGISTGPESQNTMIVINQSL